MVSDQILCNHHRTMVANLRIHWSSQFMGFTSTLLSTLLLTLLFKMGPLLTLVVVIVITSFHFKTWMDVLYYLST
jgi:hypothetical protein